MRLAIAVAQGGSGPVRLAIAVALVASCFAVYAPVRHHEFVNYDDHVAILENPNLVGGLSLESLRRAFVAPRFYNYIPVSYTHLTLPTNREV